MSESNSYDTPGNPDSLRNPSDLIPVDAYDGCLDMDTSRWQLDELTRQNERPVEQHTQRFKRGELTGLVGFVLLAVPGVPSRHPTVWSSRSG